MTLDKDLYCEGVEGLTALPEFRDEALFRTRSISNRRYSGIWTVSALALLVIAVFMAGCGAQPRLKGIHGDQLPVIDVSQSKMTEVKTPDVMQPFVPIAPAGELLVMFLGYTNCPDICPTTMSDLRSARQELSPENQERISFAFVSVDQANDTPQVLVDYTKRFSFTSFDHAIRPSEAELKQIQTTLFAASQPGARPANGTQLVDHSSYVYVVDDNAKVITEWSYPTPVADMVNDLNILLDRV